MLRLLPMTIALVMVVSAGIVHGQWTQRWTVSHAIEDAAARLERLPLVLGDWQGETLELNREQVVLAGIAGYVARRYEESLSKDAVTILLVCGSPGPISVHTPDVCYSTAGFELIGEPDLFALPIETSRSTAEFRHALLGKTNAPVPTYLRIFWSWSAAGPWEVPENPRVAFASNQVLYKLYVIRELSADDEPIEEDPSPAFLRILLPELEKLHSRPSGSGPRSVRSEHPVLTTDLHAG
ncbi:Protein of unknown function [Singulisphaera sp. GP187]|uniref:exosortase-associated EpsI family protein n=1 Tax=Singulisphaera sp. GP187 TaxID=1882752 RepID=UPI0009268E82|nr:exosortase-associated EpsI family protein [Singulisphaera sp. GP187]SIO61448.1 Protein of unknown function [Singulisphaera sp. GP187]